MMTYPKVVAVTVEQRHIDESCTGLRCETCPIALAISECFSGEYVCVTRREAEVGPNYVRYSLPDPAQAFIDQFDSKLPVEPFAFTMERVR